MYIDHIEKVAKEKKHDPYKMSKMVGLTNVTGIGVDMVHDSIVEAADIFRTRNKSLVGNSIAKTFKDPATRNRMKAFFGKQTAIGLPMSIAVAGGLTVPAFLIDYKANHKDMDGRSDKGKKHHKRADEIVEQAFEKMASYKE